MLLYLEAGDGDSLLITEPAFLTRCTWLSHAIYHAALNTIASFFCPVTFLRCPLGGKMLCRICSFFWCFRSNMHLIQFVFNLQWSVPVNIMDLHTTFDCDNLLKKSNSWSEIWNYFGFLPDETGKPIDDGKPICRENSS